LIEESGISPQTTPIFRKYVLLSRYSKLMFVYFLLVVVSMIINLFMVWAVWPPQFSETLVDYFICVALAWLLMFREEAPCANVDSAADISAARRMGPMEVPVEELAPGSEELPEEANDRGVRPIPTLIHAVRAEERDEQVNHEAEQPPDNPYDNTDL
jgi:hypothetical protein